MNQPLKSIDIMNNVMNIDKKFRDFNKYSLQTNPFTKYDYEENISKYDLHLLSSIDKSTNELDDSIKIITSGDDFKNKINNNIDDFIKKFNNIIPVLNTNYINLDNLLIAGGCVKSIIMGQYFNDIDIFVYGFDNITDAQNRIEKCINDILTHSKKLSNGDYLINEKTNDDVINTIELIRCNSKLVQEILSNENSFYKLTCDNIYSKDCDVYYENKFNDVPVNETIINFTRKILKILRQYKDKYRPHLLNVNIDKNIHVINNCYTTTLYIGCYKIQFIMRLYKSVSEILHGFDLGSSAVGFDGSQVYLTTLSKYSYENMVNIIDTTRRSTTYEKRLSKYFYFGFDIIVPHFDFDKYINEYELMKETKKDINEYYKIKLEKIDSSDNCEYMTHKTYPLDYNLCEMPFLSFKCLEYKKNKLFTRNIYTNDYRYKIYSYHETDYEQYNIISPYNLFNVNFDCLNMSIYSSYECKYSLKIDICYLKYMYKMINYNILDIIDNADYLIYIVSGVELDINDKFNFNDIIKNKHTIDLMKEVLDKIYKDIIVIIMNVSIRGETKNFNNLFNQRLQYVREQTRGELIELVNKKLNIYSDLFSNRFKRYNQRNKYCYSKKDIEKIIDNFKLIDKDIESILNKEYNFISYKLDNYVHQINWIRDNPTTQLTSSINPIIEDKSVWYGDYYKEHF